MAIAHAGMLAVLVVAAAPASAATVHAYSPLDTMTAQLAPREPDMRRPTVCTEQYAPVCGRLNNVVRTYPNQCYARAAGAEVIAQGPCNGAVVPPAPR
jgi:hypothetical protein